MPARHVPFTILLKLIRSRGPGGILGLIFIFVSLFVLTPALLVASRALTQPYQRYDYDAIRRQGTAAVARITSITPLLNVSYNGENPRVIGYTYSSESGPAADQFQTIELAKIGRLQVGDTIGVKVLNNESIIPSLQPFSFPFNFFFILPAIFLVLGVPFFLLGFLPALRCYRLYQHGVVKKATVLGISTKTIATSHRRYLQTAYVVSYEYAGLTQPKLHGESLTDDLLLVQEKKFGDPVDIFVSETDEANSCLVPRLEVLKYNWQL